MTLPKRSKKFGIGKEMGWTVYVHRNYTHVLPQEKFQTALASIPKVFQDTFTLVKYNLKTQGFTFIISPDFDTAHEPTMGDAILCLPDYSEAGYLNKMIWQQKDPWIYHHKWLMVGDDYTGFNVEASKARSEIWMSLPNVDKSRIGKRSYWEKHVVPQLTL